MDIKVSLQEQNQQSHTTEGLTRLFKSRSTPIIAEPDKLKKSAEIGMRRSAQDQEISENGDKNDLEAAIEFLAELNKSGVRLDGDMEILKEYIDQKVAMDYPEHLLTSRMRSASQRAFLMEKIVEGQNEL